MKRRINWGGKIGNQKIENILKIDNKLKYSA